MEFILVLIVCYALILYYLGYRALSPPPDDSSTPGKKKKQRLAKFGLLMGMLLLINYLVLSIDDEGAGALPIQLNIFSGAVSLTIALGYLTRRYVFGVMVLLLHFYILVQFHQYVTLDETPLSGESVGLGIFINLFFCIIVYVAAILLDHFINEKIVERLDAARSHTS